jgi:uncharacterized protein (TIGR02646 family)
VQKPLGQYIAEQFALCAYSEVVLDEADLGMHLDHVIPRSKSPGDTFSHGNLLLSAIDEAKARGLTKQDAFGGHFRGNRYHPVWFIHPLRPDSRRFFHYASDGRIEPRTELSTRDRRRAAYSIGIMNLNAPVLVNRRRRWLEEIELEIDKLLGDQVAAPVPQRGTDAVWGRRGGRASPSLSAVRVVLAGRTDRAARVTALNVSTP